MIDAITKGAYMGLTGFMAFAVFVLLCCFVAFLMELCKGVTGLNRSDDDSDDDSDE